MSRPNWATSLSIVLVWLVDIACITQSAVALAMMRASRVRTTNPWRRCRDRCASPRTISQAGVLLLIFILALIIFQIYANVCICVTLSQSFAGIDRGFQCAPYQRTDPPSSYPRQVTVVDIAVIFSLRLNCKNRRQKVGAKVHFRKVEGP